MEENLRQRYEAKKAQLVSVTEACQNVEALFQQLDKDLHELLTTIRDPTPATQSSVLSIKNTADECKRLVALFGEKCISLGGELEEMLRAMSPPNE